MIAADDIAGPNNHGWQNCLTYHNTSNLTGEYHHHAPLRVGVEQMGAMR